LKAIFCFAALAAAVPALAQTRTGELPDPNDQSDTFSIGAGAGIVPDYEGSDDYEFIPVAGIRGRWNGFNFYTRGTFLYVDFIRRGDGPVEFDFGPIVGVRLNRTGKVDDDAVDALPELDTAFEIGGYAGITYHGLTNPYDALSFHVDVITDVSDAHGSTLITPTIDFGTPLSTTTYVGVSASAEWAGDGYADYYYSIDPAGSLASGLPLFEAEGGFKHWRLGLFANQSLSGDLTQGWSIFGIGLYTKLSGDFADSPIVDDRGSSSQWFGALGVAYTF
ncbi:MAG TPA: MipA/OmpV family protein, partial [Sphingomicrobium sp.]|nr:MipA/OmpV family protein [Sphingomicrobium sp.]